MPERYRERFPPDLQSAGRQWLPLYVQSGFLADSRSDGSLSRCLYNADTQQEMAQREHGRHRAFKHGSLGGDAEAGYGTIQAVKVSAAYTFPMQFMPASAAWNEGMLHMLPKTGLEASASPFHAALDGHVMMKRREGASCMMSGILGMQPGSASRAARSWKNGWCRGRHMHEVSGGSMEILLLAGLGVLA